MLKKINVQLLFFQNPFHKFIKKEKDFDLTDRINIVLEENTPFLEQIKLNEEYISSEVLSNKIEIVSSLSNFNEIDIDEIKFKVNVEKN